MSGWLCSVDEFRHYIRLYIPRNYSVSIEYLMDFALSFFSDVDYVVVMDLCLEMMIRTISVLCQLNISFKHGLYGEGN